MENCRIEHCSFESLEETIIFRIDNRLRELKRRERIAIFIVIFLFIIHSCIGAENQKERKKALFQRNNGITWRKICDLSISYGKCYAASIADKVNFILHRNCANDSNIFLSKQKNIVIKVSETSHEYSMLGLIEKRYDPKWTNGKRLTDTGLPYAIKRFSPKGQSGLAKLFSSCFGGGGGISTKAYTMILPFYGTDLLTLHTNVREQISRKYLYDTPLLLYIVDHQNISS